MFAIDYVKLAKKLKIERIKLDYSQEEVAESVGVCQRYISKIERGAAKPEFAHIYAMADIYGVSLDYLASDENPKNDDYITSCINDRLSILSGYEKRKVLKAIEYYISEFKDNGFRMK